MFERLLFVFLIVVLGFWSWTAIQSKKNANQLRGPHTNALEMERCMKEKERSLNFGGGMSDEQRCAKELNLVKKEGEWHSRQ